MRSGVFGLVALALAACVACGQPAEESESAQLDADQQAELQGEAHGWLGVRSLEGGGGTLLHLPPRTVGGMVDADAGTARPARVLDVPPTDVASWDRRVYLFFADAGRGRVEVYSMRVSQVGVSGAWITDPAEGAAPEPILTTGGATLTDAAGWSNGAAALCRDQAWSLWVLEDEGWREVELPAALAGASGAWLVEGAAEPTLLAIGSDHPRRWTLRGPVPGTWQNQELTGASISDPTAVVAAFESAGDVCVVERSDQTVVIRALGPTLAGTIAEVPLGGELAGATTLDAGRRVGLLTVIRDPDAAGASKPVASWELVEVSVISGRELYRGPPRHPALDIQQEIRLVSLLMMGVTVCVLFYLLRPVGEHETRLPEGLALATPGRRAVAAAIDAILVGTLVSVVSGVRLSDVLLVMPLFDDSAGVLVLGAWMLGGAFYSTVAEWLTGRTLGKLAVGAQVVSVDPDRPRVGLMRTGARNVFRWVLAPWAMFGLGSPDFRHRGDLFAGAAVVVRRRAGKTEE